MENLMKSTGDKETEVNHGSPFRFPLFTHHLFPCYRWSEQLAASHFTKPPQIALTPRALSVSYINNLGDVHNRRFYIASGIIFCDTYFDDRYFYLSTSGTEYLNCPLTAYIPLPAGT